MRHPMANSIRIAACRRVQVSRQIVAAAQELYDTGGLTEDYLGEVMAAVDHGKPDLAREILERHFTIRLLAELPDDELIAVTEPDKPPFPLLRLHGETPRTDQEGRTS
jgi:hypothetical protein